MYQKILEHVKEQSGLIHCITNYVTVNDVANVILAAGASPIMADDKIEVEEITSICTALIINIGTLNERTIDSMILAGKKSNQLGHPVILDPVGAGASNLRTSTVQRLLREVKFSVIRGNISEIKTVFEGSGATMGVDANEADAITSNEIGPTLEMAKALAKKTGAVIAISGAIDIIANEQKGYAIYNGDPMMSKITGTGCMLNGMIASYVSSNQDTVLEATKVAVCAMGYCGEVAKNRCQGTSSYRMHLIDAISQLTADELERGSKVENLS